MRTKVRRRQYKIPMKMLEVIDSIMVINDGNYYPLCHIGASDYAKLPNRTGDDKLLAMPFYWFQETSLEPGILLYPAADKTYEVDILKSHKRKT